MLGEVLRSMRIYQWTKNLVLFAGVIFTLKFLSVPYLLDAVAGFFVFSLAVSGIYLLNDVLDVERDRLHPVKRTRPIASGALPVRTAAAAAFALLAVGLGGSLLIGLRFGLAAVMYVLLTLAYSLALKQVVLMDVLSIALGFVLRAVAGVELVVDRAAPTGEPIAISPWLLVCAFFLALFLAIGKRRHELTILEADASRHRAALGTYTSKLLDQLVAVVTSATVLAYSIYTIAPDTAAKFHGRPLYLTIPFVLYGIFRYLYLIHKKNLGGNPELIFLKDIPTIVNILLWVCANVVIVYFLK